MWGRNDILLASAQVLFMMVPLARIAYRQPSKLTPVKMFTAGAAIFAFVVLVVMFYCEGYLLGCIVCGLNLALRLAEAAHSVRLHVQRQAFEPPPSGVNRLTHVVVATGGALGPHTLQQSPPRNHNEGHSPLLQTAS